jgi:hypothetical protein
MIVARLSEKRCRRKFGLSQEGVKMQAVRMKVASDTVAYAGGEHHKLNGALVIKAAMYARRGADANAIDCLCGARYLSTRPQEEIV